MMGSCVRCYIPLGEGSRLSRAVLHLRRFSLAVDVIIIITRFPAFLFTVSLSQAFPSLSQASDLHPPASMPSASASASASASTPANARSRAQEEADLDLDLDLERGRAMAEWERWRAVEEANFARRLRDKVWCGVVCDVNTPTIRTHARCYA